MNHIILSVLAVSLLSAQPARFAAHTVATGLKGGYQVVVADLNHDGKPDLIALASGMRNSSGTKIPPGSGTLSRLASRA